MTENIKGAYRSALWMLMWSLSFSLAMALTKTLSEEIHTFVMLFFRFSLGYILFLPFFIRQGIPSLLKTKRFPFHLFRAALVCTAMGFTYHAYYHLPLATATSIGFTGPMMATLLSVIILKDRVSLSKWGFILLGYTGVLVIVRPGYIPFESGILMALGANFFASCAIISVKFLNKTESTHQIMFFGMSFGVLVTALAAAFVWQTPATEDLIRLSLIGGLGAFSQLCYVLALKRGKPAMVTPFEYTRLVIAIPIGLIFFEEVPTLWSFVGSLIIVVSNFFLTLSDQHSQKIWQVLGRKIRLPS